MKGGILMTEKDLIQVMNKLSPQFNLNDEKEFKSYVSGANVAYREGILSKDMFRLLMLALFVFKTTQTAVNDMSKSNKQISNGSWEADQVC
jgi:hypothetical protein